MARFFYLLNWTKLHFLLVCCLIIPLFSNAQITYNWSSFPSGGTSYSNTQGSGCNMNTTVNGVEFNGGSPRFDNAVGTNGAGLFLDHNWSTINSETNVISSFAPALTNPSFTLYDINHNANTSDFCSNAWTDSVYVTAVGATGVTFSQTNPIQQTVFVSGSTIRIRGNAACNQTSQGSVTINFTGPVTQITIKYRSGLRVTRCTAFTPCGAAVTPPCATLGACTNPGRQFITIGNITGSSCCSGAVAGPTSITGNTGPFCGATTTTLTASGAFASSQWHSGSCSGPLLGTGTSLVVTPAVTTTYYVNNLDCNNNPIGCAQITVTVSPSPSVPTISNTGLNICSGNTTTLTSSSATGNLWSNGSTSNSIVVSAAGTYTVRVTNASGCSSGPASAVVTIAATPANPTITAIGSPTACQGNNVILSSSSAVSNVWSTGATTQTISVSTSGIYSVTLSAGSCSSNASFSVTIIPRPLKPTITNTGLNICAGQSTTLTSSNATGNIWSTGSSSNAIVVSASGTYSLTVTNASGCVSNPASAVISIIAPPTTPIITASGTPTICQGNSVVLSSSAVTGNVWNTGATTQTLAVSSTGNYSVLLGSGSCTSTASFSVSVLPVPSTPTISATNLTVCAGQSITLSSSSGVNNTWSTGETTNSIIVNSSGNYSLSLAGINGCVSNPVSINVTVNPPNVTPTISAVGSPSVCQGSSVVLSSSAALDNVWSNGATTQTISVNTPGNFSVTTGVGSCTTSASFSVTVFPIPSPPIVASTGINLCAGQSATLTSSSILGNTWSTGATTNSISVSSAGIYSVNFANAQGCVSPTSTISITISTVVVDVIVPTNTIVCNGAIVSLSNFNSSALGTSFIWQNSNSSVGLPTNGIGNLPVFTASNLTTGLSNAVITVTPSASGCIGIPIAFTISVSPALNVNAGLNDTICFGSSSNLFVSPNGTGFSYNWSNGNSLSNTISFNPIANPTVTTIYNVVVTNSNGCIGSDNVTVYVNSPINVSIISTSITCFGSNNGTASSSVTGGIPPYTYTWNTGELTPNLNGLVVSNYSLVVVDAIGCPATQTTNVSQPLPLILSVTNFSPTTCSNSCDGKAFSVATGGNGIYTYSWNTSPNQSSANATGLCGGNYLVSVTDGNNCISTASIAITSPLPVSLLSIPNATICFGASTNLFANAVGGNGNNFSYIWSPPTNLSSVSTQSVIANPTTNIVYSVTATDVSGCSSPTQSVSVFVRPQLNLSVNSSSIICLGNSAQLSALGSGGISSNYSYSWQSITGLNNSLISNPIATPSVTTVYTITLSDGCSNPTTTQYTVNILSLPMVTFSISNPSGCAPLCVNILNTSIGSSGAITNWYWNFGGNSNSNLQSPQHCFLNSGNFPISLTATDSNGCSAVSTLSSAVQVYPNPVANFDLPESVSLFENTVQITDLSIGATQWNWNFNLTDPLSVSTSTIQNPIQYFPLQGVYCVGLIVKNNFGCTDTEDKCITIRPEVTIYVPNAFTPNDDNVNDGFYAYGINILEFEMLIFDRWGEQIFYSNDMKIPWNGKAKGGSEIAQQGVYVWKIKAKDVFNKPYNLVGHVTLLK